MNNYVIRRFGRTDNDYDNLTAVWNQCYPDLPRTVAEIKQDDDSWNGNIPYTRWLVVNGDSAIGTGSVCWEDNNEVEVSFHLPAAHQTYAPTLIPFLCGEAKALGYERPITTLTKVSETWRDGVLRSSGFVPITRRPISFLDVNACDITPFQADIARLEVDGIEFLTLVDVMERDPEWRRNIYDLFTAIDRDIPYGVEWQQTPFEDYARYYEGEDFRPKSWHIAYDTNSEQYVGMSVVNSSYTPGALFAGITGTIRSHRRRKIATTLKIKTIEYARREGFTAIKTDNEENNPMYKLNLQLGFETTDAWVDWRLERRD